MNKMLVIIIVLFFTMQDNRLPLFAEENGYFKNVESLKAFQSLDFLFKFDYEKLRENYFNTPEMKEDLRLVSKTLQDQFDKAWSNSDADQIIELGQKILNKDFTDSRTHTLLAQTYHERGEEEKRAFHGIIGVGLNKSILSSGDGNSFDTAYKVFQVKEEYHLLKSMGYFKVLGQKMIQHEDKYYDLVEAENYESKEIKTFYFDVTDWFGRLSTRLETNSSEKAT